MRLGFLCQWLTVWSAAASDHTVKPRKLLPLGIFWAMLEALKTAGSVASFLTWTVVLLVACLRFAHSKQSHSLRLHEGFLRATCSQGKRRVQGRRPPFDWALSQSIDLSKQLLLDNSISREIEVQLGRPPTLLARSCGHGSATDFRPPSGFFRGSHRACHAGVQDTLAQKSLSAQASKLRGRLQWASSAMYGRVARGGQGPLVRRQYEDADDLTPELSRSLKCMLALLQVVGPREVPLSDLALVALCHLVWALVPELG